jgi:hypothetical protein
MLFNSEKVVVATAKGTAVEVNEKIIEVSSARLLSRHIGMLGAKGLLPNRQRALVERLGFGVMAHVIVDKPSRIEINGIIGLQSYGFFQIPVCGLVLNNYRLTPVGS